MRGRDLTGRSTCCGSMAAMASGPLAGIRIIEIAGIGPGPFAGFMLADLGADIIKVDRAQNVRGGDPGHARRPTSCSGAAGRSAST